VFHVTGVQTCALPILGKRHPTLQRGLRRLIEDALSLCVCVALAFPPAMIGESLLGPTASAQTYNVGFQKYRKGDLAGAEGALIRSEERRGGEEGTLRV